MIVRLSTVDGSGRFCAVLPKRRAAARRRNRFRNKSSKNKYELVRDVCCRKRRCTSSLRSRRPRGAAKEQQRSAGTRAWRARVLWAEGAPVGKRL